MDTATQVLVIIVSIFLILFLAISIAIGVLLYRLINTIKSVAAKVDHVTDSAEAVGDFFRKSAGPVAVAKLVGTVVESVMHHTQNAKSKGGK